MQDDAQSSEKPDGYGRKRVAKACLSCRAMKSKCDGHRPKCDRCVRYGYQCMYSIGKPRKGILVQEEQFEERLELRKVLIEYDNLLDSLCPGLASSERERLQRTRSRIKTHANAALISNDAPLLPSTPSTHLHEPEASTPRLQVYRSERYLGEVSDVRFFNLVKRVLRTQAGPFGLEPGVDSYEQDDAAASASTASSRATQLPEPDDFAELTGVYFSTIHLAYPFIPRSAFLQSYDSAQKLGRSPDSFDTTQMSLLYVICSIGSFYNSFPSDQTAASELHEAYFLRALSLAPPSGIDLSINHVSLLLAECFYLLAVCRIDSCWATLGQAVRTAQSIGLHVEQKTTLPVSPEIERRRRLWYSIYVLDRLLSLQLGRPPAIHDADCDVPLPSRVGDGDIDWDADEVQASSEGFCAGDYFLAVISFSEIVGHVLRDLYSPKPCHNTGAGMSSTKDLDRRLLQWKLHLQRPLRFDLGHAFDTSTTYKRQRNMLAIKYHHLRALIHRPYLCFPLLRNAEGTGTAPVDHNWASVSACEKICITEARETARLLHNISSEKELVHDFPWWQMISCLICAGSILLVSSIFIQQIDEEASEFSAECLSDDAETCLRVFEALSTKSAGARIARDMMETLKECGLAWKVNGPTKNLHHASSGRPYTSQEGRVAGTDSSPDLVNLNEQDMSMGGFPLSAHETWPAEIVDSMTWSAQFLGAFQS
ncbi:unnamed protein product [Clonostachys rosea]|uniref:Zn(2)-C6 fungal-type domain-containing protein n=1 Tax=Bionectria ochroleuca TaxID=29856 RepID=A0ABY6UU88_BIOOC|nr:unnamed protein product [Clonostachys rosea]